MTSERLSIKKNASLGELQQYVGRAIKKSGLSPDQIEATLYMSEELGKTAKAIRKDSGIAIRPESKTVSKEEAVAGLLFFALHLANLADIDLEKAFRDREKKLKRRKNRLD